MSVSDISVMNIIKIPSSLLLRWAIQMQTYVMHGQKGITQWHMLIALLFLKLCITKLLSKAELIRKFVDPSDADTSTCAYTVHVDVYMS